MTDNEYANIQRKIIELKKPKPGSDVVTVVTKKETLTEDTEKVEISAVGCGHFKPEKTFFDRFSGMTICEQCSRVCRICGVRFFSRVGSKGFLSEDYYCPDHRLTGLIRSIGKALLWGLKGE